MDSELSSEGGTNQAEQFWEEHYRAQEQVWSGRANAVLVDVVGSLPPGRALDLGCGEGGDAIWLAQRGWRVTAADVSATALARVAARAAEAGVEAGIDCQQHDLGSSFPGGTFDLVSAQFLQSPVEFPHDLVLQAAAQAVAPGGLLLIVEHGAPPPWAAGSHSHARFPSPGETLAALELTPGQWHTELVCSRQREAEGPNGQTGILTDSIIAVIRMPPDNAGADLIGSERDVLLH